MASNPEDNQEVSLGRNLREDRAGAGLIRRLTSDFNAIQNKQKIQQRQTFTNLSRQLDSINGNILKIGNNIQAISQGLSSEILREQVRVQDEKNRRIRAAEQESFGQAEKALETSITTAIVSPVKSINTAVSGALESLTDALMLLFTGWLTDKVIKNFDTYRETAIQKLEELQNWLTDIPNLAVNALGSLSDGFDNIVGTIRNISNSITGFLKNEPFRKLSELFQNVPTPVIPPIPNLNPAQPAQTPQGQAPQNIKPSNRLSGFFKGAKSILGKGLNRGLLVGGGALEYKEARESGYNQLLAGLKATLVTGGSWMGGGLAGAGMAATGVGAPIVIPTAIGAAMASGYGIETAFENMMGQYKSRGSGQFDLQSMEGTVDPNYDIFLDESGKFEVKDTSGFFGGFGKPPILKSENIISGEQVVDPEGLNAKLLESALYTASLIQPDKIDYYESISKKVFGGEMPQMQSNTLKMQRVANEVEKSPVISPPPERTVPPAKIMQPPQVAEGTPTFIDLTSSGTMNEQNMASSLGGAQTEIPAISTSDADNPYTLLMRSIYNVVV